MAELAEIISRLRQQHAEVATLAADAIERLVASEAEARATLADMQRETAQLLALLSRQYGEALDRHAQPDVAPEDFAKIREAGARR